MAAVVSDNDGSAFITKAEFDSMKNDFQSQIDQYNTSIDSKIDGAIGAYLSGIRISTATDKKLKYADWKQITFLNFSPQNVCASPNIAMSFSESYKVTVTGDSTYAPTEIFSGLASAVYNRTTGNNFRCIADGGGNEGTSNMPDTVVWEGRARNLNEKFTCAVSFLGQYSFANPGHAEGAIWTPYLYGLEDHAPIYACGMLVMKAGYYPDGFDHFSNKTWWPRFYYNKNASSSKTHGYLDTIQTKANNNSFDLNWSISLDPDSSGLTKDYEHIIEYNDVEFPQLTDLDWSHTIRALDNGITLDELKDMAIWNSRLSYIERPGSAAPSDIRGSADVRQCHAFYAGDWNTSNSNRVLGVGIIDKKYTSEKILQTKEKETFEISASDQIVAPKVLNLYEGFPLFASDVGTQIEWKPVFIDTQVDGASQSFELNIMLALEPFGEEDSVSVDKMIKINGTTNDYVTTSSGISSIKFIMPEKGIVYMKAWPADSTILTKNWEATLDLANCGRYTETKE